MLHTLDLVRNTLVTLSFRVSESEKEYANGLIEAIAEQEDMNKSESLIEILRRYERSLIDDKTNENWVPPNVSQVLKTIDCEFLKFYDQDFVCLEKYHSTKKPVLLEGSPQQVQDGCQACGYYREKKRLQKIQELRQKEYIKRLEKFMKGLMRITEKGFITDIQFCICDVLEGDLGFSRDGLTLKCPLENGEIVYINDKCKTLVNNENGLPPCKFFASLERLVRIQKEDWEKENLTLPQTFLEDLDLDKPEYQDQEPPRETIEAEYEIKENGGENE